jgi:hypothetical protein
LRSQIGLLLWNIWKQRWKLIVPGRSLETIRISAKESLGYCELKEHKPWFYEGSSKLVNQRKQDKLQWLQDPSEINGDNMRIVRYQKIF